MINLFRHYIDNFKSLFDHSSDIYDESIFQYIQDDVLPKYNCKRIFAYHPVLLIFPVANFITHIKCGIPDSLPHIISLLCSIMIIIFTTYIFFHINLIQHSSKTVSSKHFYYTYVSYWLVWGGLTNVIAFIRLLEGLGADFFLLSSLVVNLIPITTKKGFKAAAGGQSIIYTLITLYILIYKNLGMLPLNTFRFRLQISIACFFFLFLGSIIQYLSVRIFTVENYVKFKAYVDPLTGLMNRTGGNYEITEFMKVRPTGSQIGIIMLDIDYFKTYNDTFGHILGDDCLHKVADTALKVIRSHSDIFIRHGGEEFVAILFDTTEQQTLHVAERIRLAVYSMELDAACKNTADYVTVSIGVSSRFVKGDFHYEDVIAEADKALYHSKENGRNRVTAYSEL